MFCTFKKGIFVFRIVEQSEHPWKDSSRDILHPKKSDGSIKIFQNCKIFWKLFSYNNGIKLSVQMIYSFLDRIRGVFPRVFLVDSCGNFLAASITAQVMFKDNSSKRGPHSVLTCGLWCAMLHCKIVAWSKTWLSWHTRLSANDLTLWQLFSPKKIINSSRR